MSILPTDYANTDAEFERILAASLNDCIVSRQDISDILLTKSVYLYVSNLLKMAIIHQSAISNCITSKCISCYTESQNVFNICKCGLEHMCYSCMLTKYVSILTNSIKADKSSAITNNTFNKKFMITLLENTVCCKYCNVPGFFHKTIPLLNYEQINKSNKHMLCETDFLNNENKTMIDIFPNMSMTNFIQQKNMEAVTNYGFELEYNHDMQNILFKINAKLVEHIVGLPSCINYYYTPKGYRIMDKRVTGECKRILDSTVQYLESCWQYCYHLNTHFCYPLNALAI